jgi:hypothetical protein
MKNLTQETIAHTIRTAPETSPAQTIRDFIFGDRSMPSDHNAIISVTRELRPEAPCKGNQSAEGLKRF